MIPFAEKSKDFFEWTPEISCSTGTPPTVRYSKQEGKGFKMKIKDGLYIVFVSCYITGYIDTADNSGYAVITGLKHSVSDIFANNGFYFSQFYYGIDTSHAVPLGQFANNKRISIRNGNSASRGGNSERWVADADRQFIISGNGFYYTEDL